MIKDKDKKQAIETVKKEKVVKKKKRNVVKTLGRPSSITNEKVLELKELVLKGLNINEALHSVGISKTSYYNYCESQKDFKELMMSLKGISTKTQAKLLIYDDIVVNKNVNTAKFVLEKTDDDYKPSSKIDISVNQMIDKNSLLELASRVNQMQDTKRIIDIEPESE